MNHPMQDGQAGLVFKLLALWANSADDKLRIIFFCCFFGVFFFFFSPENTEGLTFLHEMSKPVFWEKSEKYFKMLSAVIFT